MKVPIEKIHPSPHQPRKQFAQKEIDELAISIRSLGLLQPLIVRRDGETYKLIAGERRLRAAKQAGLKEIPVILWEGERIAEAALVENVQRVDLSSVEIATALQRLIDEFGLSQNEVAERVGKGRSTVANYLRLLRLPERMQQSVDEGRLSMSHAKLLLSVDGEEQEKLYHRMMDEGLSTRAAVKRDVHIEECERMLEEALGTCVRITPRSIQIDYQGLDELNDLLDRLALKS